MNAIGINARIIVSVDMINAGRISASAAMILVLRYKGGQVFLPTIFRRLRCSVQPSQKVPSVPRGHEQHMPTDLRFIVSSQD